MRVLLFTLRSCLLSSRDGVFWRRGRNLTFIGSLQIKSKALAFIVFAPYNLKSLSESSDVFLDLELYMRNENAG